MIFDLHSATVWLLHYRYLALFPITIIEGPIITVIAGFLSAQGYLSAFLVYPLAVAGDLVGDTIYYLIGRLGREKFILRWGKFLNISLERVAKLEKHFEKHSGKTLIFGKLTQLIGSLILTAAGVAKVPLKKFWWFNFLATLPKSLVLLLIGYFFGKFYKEINTYFTYTGIVSLAVTGLLIVAYLAMINLGKKIEKK